MFYSKLFTSGLNMGLPQWYRVETARKEKVLDALVSKEGYPERSLT